VTGRRTILIEHDGATYHGQLARIDSTRLGWEDHGILTAYLNCSWASGGIGVGGFCLDTPQSREKRDAGDYSRKGTAYGLDHLMRLMETVGVDRWEKLPGQQVLVLFEDSGGPGSISVGIANALDEDKVLVLQQHAEAWRRTEATR
jgi:hypothetical protein